MSRSFVSKTQIVTVQNRDHWQKRLSQIKLSSVHSFNSISPFIKLDLLVFDENGGDKASLCGPLLYD
jgi:hypothetical protein